MIDLILRPKNAPNPLSSLDSPLAWLCDPSTWKIDAICSLCSPLSQELERGKEKTAPLMMLVDAFFAAGSIALAWRRKNPDRC